VVAVVVSIKVTPGSVFFLLQMSLQVPRGGSLYNGLYKSPGVNAQAYNIIHLGVIHCTIPETFELHRVAPFLDAWLKECGSWFGERVGEAAIAGVAQFVCTYKKIFKNQETCRAQGSRRAS